MFDFLQAQDPHAVLRAMDTYEQRLIDGAGILTRGIDTQLNDEDAHWAPARLKALHRFCEAMSGDSHVQLTTELVVGLNAGEIHAFGHITQGPTLETLTQSLGHTLQTAMALHLEHGGSAQAAQAMAQWCAALLPGMQQLERYPAATMALLAGTAVGPLGCVTKLYFNTRIDISTPHNQRVADAIARLADLEGQKPLEVLTRFEGLNFRGVGVDFVPSAQPRVKLYGNIQQGHWDAMLAHLDRLEVFDKTNISPLDDILRTLSPLVVDEIEVGLSLRPNQTSLKLTVFPRRKSVSATQVLDALPQVLLSPASRKFIVDAAAALGVDGIQKAAFHALGFESGTDKLNVYLMPVT